MFAKYMHLPFIIIQDIQNCDKMPVEKNKDPRIITLRSMQA